MSSYVATALQHPMTEQQAVYVLWGRRYVYTGETKSMRQRGIDRLLHGNDIVAICHPMLRETTNRLWMERIAHAAAAAAGVITPFQEEPAGGAWPGDETYYALLLLWDSVVPVVDEFAGLCLPWTGPMSLVRAKLNSKLMVVRRESWQVGDTTTWASVHSDGSYTLEAPGRRLHAPKFHPASTLELVACGALEYDEKGSPTLIKEPIGFRDSKQLNWFITGQFGGIPNGPLVTDHRDAVRRMIAAREAGLEEMIKLQRRSHSRE